MYRDVNIPTLILGVAYFLLVIISFKLVCSCIFRLFTLYDDWIIRRTISKFKEDVNNDNEATNENELRQFI